MSDYHMSIKNIAAINAVMDDLWNRNVTPENFAEWRNNNGGKILDSLVSTECTLKAAGRVKVKA